jgi:ATP-dependent DNA helicase PIF1
MLNAMRFGRLDASAIAAFSGLSRAVHFDDGIDLTELYVSAISFVHGC